MFHFRAPAQARRKMPMTRAARCKEEFPSRQFDANAVKLVTFDKDSHARPPTFDAGQIKHEERLQIDQKSK
jgi:hypothetical protein